MYEIVVPYWNESGPERRANLEVVEAHLALLGMPVHVSSYTPEERGWSPGAARNFGAGQVEAPVVVFCDADTITPHVQIERAAELAYDGPGLAYGYTLYCRLTREATLEVRAGREAGVELPLERHIVGAPSMGCAAVSLESFRRAGGFPEWPGWGYEDLEFAGRCAARWPVSRVEGCAFHLWHGGRRADDSPLDSDAGQVVENLDRWAGAPDRPPAAA